MDPLIVSFRGREAERHRLPAYSAAQSLYGISRSLLIIMNYVHDGKVRKRDVELHSRGVRIDLVAQRAGSFEFVLDVLADPIARGVATKVAGDLVTDLIKSMLKRVVGQRAEKSIEELEENDDLNSGDLGALVDAIEPAMKAAHQAVGNGATTIVLVQGDNNIIRLNEGTKRYISSSRLDEMPNAKLFSIASYNTNTRYGRAFDYELGHTVPFSLHRQADRTTLSTMLSSMQRYALSRIGDENRSAIAIKYLPIMAPDDRVKKIILLKARPELSDLEGDR